VTGDVVWSCPDCGTDLEDGDTAYWCTECEQSVPFTLLRDLDGIADDLDALLGADDGVQ
jgi:hypothetical protein